jgi:DNA repair protein RadC
MMQNAKVHNRPSQLLGRFVEPVQENVSFLSPKDVAEYLLKQVYYPFDEFEQEEFVSLLLNAHHQVTHRVLVSRGTLRSALVRPAEVFRAAIRVNAAEMIVAHNHPSGNATMSNDDELITRRLVEAAEILDIPLLDHLVVGRDSWTSMRAIDESIFECSTYSSTYKLCRDVLA